MKNIIFLFVLFVISGCTQVPTRDINIETAVDPEADFSGYKSYAWLGSAVFLNDPSGQWEQPGFDADAEIKYLIDRELRDRGMSESTISPDMIVAFVAGVDMDALDLNLNPETSMKTPQNIPQGGLVITLIDSSTGFVIWLGVATAEIQQQADTNIRKARLNYAVSQLLETIPE